MNDQNEAKLIFVFNADSGGLFNAFKDSLHKTSRKSTYECNLCKFTYGFFGMKKEWKDFVNGLDVPVEYMKKDHFKFEFLVSFSTLRNFFNGQYPQTWYWNPCWTYVLLKEGVKPQDVERCLQEPRFEEFFPNHG